LNFLTILFLFLNNPDNILKHPTSSFAENN
jgi:hypothetical protein